MTILDIKDNIRTILEQGLVYDEETGEVFFDTSDLEALEMSKNEKTENLLMYSKELLMKIDALKSEKKNIDKKMKQAENEYERLKDYAQLVLEGEKFETARVKVSYRKTQSLEVLDESLVPEDYRKYSFTVDKTLAKNEIKSGGTVPGCEVIEKISMSIK